MSWYIGHIVKRCFDILVFSFMVDKRMEYFLQVMQRLAKEKLTFKQIRTWRSIVKAIFCRICV